MNPALLLSLVSWIQAIRELYKQGDEAVAEVKAVLKQRGIEADNATLDGIALDADVRKAREDARIAAGGEPPVG